MKGRKNFGNRGFHKPVKVGDIIEGKIEGHGKNGDGVMKIDGYVLFVKGETVDNEVYKVKVLSVGNRFGTAEVVA